jgi:hypothetical protein
MTGRWLRAKVRGGRRPRQGAISIAGFNLSKGLRRHFHRGRRLAFVGATGFARRPTGARGRQPRHFRSRIHFFQSLAAPFPADRSPTAAGGRTRARSPSAPARASYASQDPQAGTDCERLCLVGLIHFDSRSCLPLHVHFMFVSSSNLRRWRVNLNFGYGRRATVGRTEGKVESGRTRAATEGSVSALAVVPDWRPA